LECVPLVESAIVASATERTNCSADSKDGNPEVETQTGDARLSLVMAVVDRWS
jgi:hypothetical protein